MTDTIQHPRPAPRWFRIGAILMLAIALFPLVLGQTVTSIRAGMADPKWPTEPWYLLNNFRLDFGYLVEHSHRIAGFALGGLLSLLTLGLWWGEPRARPRWAGLAGLVLLLAGYGELHRALMNQPEDAATVIVPAAPAAILALTLFGLLCLGLSGLVMRSPGAALRLLAVIALAAVMIQGVLGGARVRYNALKGPELAAIHGAFAQVVFCLLVALTALSGRIAGRTASGSKARWLSVALVGLLLVQLVWGVLVRHVPTPLGQRLHLFTAFLVVAGAVWLIGLIRAEAASRAGVSGYAILLGVLVFLQVALGVEAWMGKFGTNTLPELEQVTQPKAAIRTAHVLIGTALLGTAVALVIRLSDSPRLAGSVRPSPPASRGLSELVGETA